jgi:hypothetical protein
MTKKAGIRESDLRRMIRAARKEGLHVVGMRPDGTLLLSEVPLASTGVAGEETPDQAFDRWLRTHEGSEWGNPEV